MCAFVFLFKIYFCFLIVCACKWVCAPFFWVPMFSRLLETQSKHEQNSRQAGDNHWLSFVFSPFSNLPTPITLRLLAFHIQAGNRFICLFFWRSVFRATGSRRVYSGVGQQAMWGPLKGTNKDKSELDTGVERGYALHLSLLSRASLSPLSWWLLPQISLPWLSQGSFLCSVSILDFRFCLWPCVCPAVSPYLVAQMEIKILWRFQGARDSCSESHGNERTFCDPKSDTGPA